MGTVVDVLDWINLGLLTLAAVVALRLWRTRAGTAALWAAVTFAALAVVVDVAQLLPDDATGFWEVTAERLLISLLVLFPYFLFRFTTAFERPSRRTEQLLGLSTVILLVWTFLVPAFPGPGEPQSTGVTAYVLAFVAHWALLSSVSTWRMWRAGAGQPAVARRRMHLLATATATLTLALVLAALSSERDAVALATSLLVSVSALLFLLGLAPPAWLRLIWRRPEQERMQLTTANLMSATSEEEVVAQVLEPMARLVAARGLALVDEEGRTIAAHGETEHLEREQAVLRFPLPTGAVIVSPSPYAPFFGSDELRILRALTGLAGLALDRSRLFERERDARLVLERADELKSEFVALAAHELRSPVSSIYGLAETLYARADQLDESRRIELREAIRDQARRLTVLVEQLLDLSRLDAEAVELYPVRFPVRERVEELVGAVAGMQAIRVEIAVDEELEALADPNAFDRVVSNLVANAIKYGSPPVRVAAVAGDNHFRIAVEDAGPGVAPEFIPRLFERFSRSEHAQRTVVGTGLGLAIARSYARASGGDLVYLPRVPSGSRFELVLPIR